MCTKAGKELAKMFFALRKQDVDMVFVVDLFKSEILHSYQMLWTDLWGKSKSPLKCFHICNTNPPDSSFALEMREKVK